MLRKHWSVLRQWHKINQSSWVVEVLEVVCCTGLIFLPLRHPESLLRNRSFGATIGDALHNNHRMMDENKAFVSQFGNESTLCDNIMWCVNHGNYQNENYALLMPLLPLRKIPYYNNFEFICNNMMCLTSHSILAVKVKLATIYPMKWSYDRRPDGTGLFYSIFHQAITICSQVV